LAQTSSLSCIQDCYGKFAVIAPGENRVTAFAQLSRPTALRSHRDESYLARVVDSDEAPEHLRRELTQRAHETEVPGLW
jgi:hypothetical protein